MAGGGSSEDVPPRRRARPAPLPVAGGVTAEQADLYETLKQRAMRMLGRRPYTAARVREKLMDVLAGSPVEARRAEEVVDAVLARLAELRLLDDRRYAEAFVRERFERGGYGSHRIRRDLEASGVTAADAAAAVDAIIDEGAERVAARSALLRYRRRSPGDARPEREFRHLVARGFPAAIVRDLIGGSL